ncbi:putative beta-1,6-glucan boisynthesis protein [Eremomyces bilateralis CBS 781.70]|uniref:Beta-1,6-glucan boisynthesis protein n=1 Tax=Eremomyces bilateralis CBS 781.70 TaxID=1392243 RepID=A0A6G1G1V1_9PEZI|nr:putative beta-1,6-glucan boisynthesis protein [Eremomyces bilateralis CBS 781.70]KAF1812087.1 putative beta-1,6-glucan boisynthesis protein [Eremomyces bilateralis CBS 781.70]
MRSSLLVLWTSLASAVLADITFVTPAPGSTIPVGAVSMEWKDSGEAPALADLTTYEVFLCAGGNTDGTFIDLVPLVKAGQFSMGNIAQGVVSATVGGPEKNAYFIKIISTSPKGTVTNYSGRFTLSGMTGTFPANVVTALSTLGSTTAGPARKNAMAAANPGATGDFAVPFGQQTGLTRYAPMQSLPPTQITAKDKPPLYPTSNVIIATAFLPPASPSIMTTVTQSKSYTITMIENPAPPGPGVNEDMQKFLNRWKD